MPSLSELAGTESVEHVVVFIADSLRFDHLADPVRDRGVTARTISPSTFTASSVPSMMTGTYPAAHRVWNFEDVLPETPPLFDGEHRSMVTQHVWEDLAPPKRPPMRTLRLDTELRPEDVHDADSSLVVVHDRGAHGPYDYLAGDYDDSPSFFSALGDRPEELRELYARGARDACDRFLDMVDQAEADGRLADTLFVFTSDHGELLGERDRGGVFGHGSPMCPELVEVPTVFLGAGLPEGEGLAGLVSGVDLAPTLLGAQDRPVPKHVDGVDLWTDSAPTDRIVRSEIWANTGSVTYGAGSAWTDEGGLVRHLAGRFRRLAFGVDRNLRSGAQAPANRAGLPWSVPSLLRLYGRTELTFGDPAVERLREAVVTDFRSGDAEYDVAGPDEDQLAALGYVE
ncbi:sulfatase-like hydrolase/transferase [Halorientalis marina]|uniref:sulfatase-like hydrolase/transferase n=1 Tax=Halorientalis marina TaxID=2931976 RepID=UPI001FF40C59|nr:sulfatase-like hydrolase/transferase [Halorientalis marina]